MLLALLLVAGATEPDAPAPPPAPPEVRAQQLRPRTTPQPELSPALLGLLEPGSTLVCPVSLVVRADGSPDEVVPQPDCPGLVAVLATETVSRWTWWPPLAEGRNQAVRTIVRVELDVPAPVQVLPTVAGLSPGQLEALLQDHDLRPDGASDCRIRVSIGEDGRIRRRTTNLGSCLVDTRPGAPPPPAFATDRRACDLRLITTASKVEGVRVSGCGPDLKAWTEATVSSWLWVSTTPEPVAVYATLIFPRED